MKCYEIVNHLNIEQKISNYIRDYFYSFNKKNGYKYDAFFFNSELESSVNE